MKIFILTQVRNRFEKDETGETLNDPHNRIYTLGIGASHSTSLCVEIAENTRAQYASVFADIEIPSAVADLFVASQMASGPDYRYAFFAFVSFYISLGAFFEFFFGILNFFVFLFCICLKIF